MCNYRLTQDEINSVELLGGQDLQIKVLINGKYSFCYMEGSDAIDELLRCGFYDKEQHKIVYEKYKTLLSYDEDI
jgi:hypothetical protein